MRRLLLISLMLAGTQACVYYNGMYNANRLAKSARKAERDGRTFEANGLWGQVVTKAESVVVRHPTSKYAAQAQVLRGVGLARMGQCDQALPSLSATGTADISTSLREEALLAAGRCQVATGNLEAGDAAFVQLLESKDPDHRREAQYQHARILRLGRRYEEALQALPETKDLRTQTERFLALASMGKVSPAMALADSLMIPGDTSKHWDSLVVELGKENPVTASHLVDRVRALAHRTQEAEARLLLEDGLRLTAVDTGRAAKRLRQVVEVGPSTVSGPRASLELLRLELRQVSQPESLGSVGVRLKNLASRSPGIAEEISLLADRVDEIQLAGAMVPPDTTQGDLRLFLAAEFARDSLAAPSLAEGMFRRILDHFPDSPYAPKAVLAVQHLNPGWVDSARTLLEERYSASPYLAMVRGEATDEYRALEDSLGAFARTQLAGKATSNRRKALTAEDEIEREKLKRRRTVPPGGTRVPGPQ